MVRPADCTCSMAAERYNMVTHYDAGGMPYGAASCVLYLWYRSILEYISTKRIPAGAEGGCADGDISK